MRIALFGGTFDPPHRGHVALARLAQERLSLDQVLVAPVAMQPLKQETTPASFTDRVAMTRLAFASERAMKVSLIDAPRADGRSNYTIDTIAGLRRKIHPDDTLFCLMGADSFLTIGKWHFPADLLASCDFIVGARPGFDLAQTTAALPDGISAKPMPSTLAHAQTLELIPERIATEPQRPGHAVSHLYLLTDLAEDVSATQIRSALRGEGEPGRILNPAVEEYIREHHLYEHL